MEILKIVLMILFAIDCIALSAIVLLQEGKSAGLGTISGMADTYWGQNKGRSMEGALVKSTKFLAVLFIVLAAVLNLKAVSYTHLVQYRDDLYCEWSPNEKVATEVAIGASVSGVRAMACMKHVGFRCV